MVDRLFSEPRLAALYDAWCAGRPDWKFYLPLVMKSASVLDVGCGTGELLKLARDRGQNGRLCGLDPAEAMLDIARRRQEIEWVLGDLSSVSWDREFDLIVMTGNAFQVLVTDDELRVALAAIRAALKDDGRFAFDTRNPVAREWELWEDKPNQIVVDGRVVTISGPKPMLDGDLLSFSTVFTCPAWNGPEVSHSTLRLHDVDALARRFAEAGLAIDALYGDWDGLPLTDERLEIVTIARRA